MTIATSLRQHLLYGIYMYDYLTYTVQTCLSNNIRILCPETFMQLHPLLIATRVPLTPSQMTPSLKSYIVDYISPLNPIKLASPSSDTANYSGSYISYIPQFHYLPIHSHASWCSMLFPVFLHQNHHFHPDFPFRCQGVWARAQRHLWPPRKGAARWGLLSWQSSGTPPPGRQAKAMGSKGWSGWRSWRVLKSQFLHNSM